MSTFWFSEDALNSCLLRKRGNRLEQTTALDGLLELCFGLGDPYIESNWLATDTARSVSFLTHVHVRYGVDLFLIVNKGDLVCFLGQNRFYF